MSSEIVTILVSFQLLLDIILLFLIYIVYRRLQTLSPQNLNTLLALLGKSEKLSSALQENLKQKAMLVGQLERPENTQGESSSPQRPGTSSPSPEEAKHMKRARVISLWEEGKSAHEIAAEADMAVGEVELLVSLAKATKGER